MMFSLKVGGEWLRGHGPITVEFGEHGCEAASWEMRTTYRHPQLRGNAFVQVFDGGFPIWAGTLNEPGAEGAYVAKGLWRQATTIPALDNSLAITTRPDLAIGAAINRGEIPNWLQYVSISDVAWSIDATDLTLAQLLDWYAAENALRWSVNGRGELTMQADPTTPKWHVPHAIAGRGLTPAEDEFATHLVGRYVAVGGADAAVTVGSTEASNVFGRRTVKVDLSPAGEIDAAKATSILNGMFLRSGARMGWGEGLELTHGQITTPGDTPASLNQIRSGDMVRLSGTVDTSRPHLMRGYTDIVLATVKYTEGSGVISMTPHGQAARTLGDVLTLAVEE